MFGGLFDAFVSKMIFPYKTVARPEPARNLGIWETNIPLALSNLVFLMFALLQLRYILGGYGAIGPTGFTYAEYAKNGYFELSVAAAISFVVIFLIGRQAILQDNRLNGLTKRLCVGLAVQVGFVIWCAFSRLSMYQEAYGLTLTRFYGYVFLIWMAGAFLFLSWKTWTDAKMAVFGKGIALWILVTFAALDLVNPSGFVASENIGRPNDPEVINSYPMRGKSSSSIGVDHAYLSRLSLDAIPDTAPTMTPIQLQKAYADFAYNPKRPWFTFHVARLRAVNALGVRAEELGVRLK